MAKYEFRFVVSGDKVQLKDEHLQAAAQAAALALAEATPINAVTVSLGNRIWWRGLPPVELLDQIEGYAREQVDAAG